MPIFVALGCLEVGEKFRGGEVWSGWSYFHSEKQVTPT